MNKKFLFLALLFSCACSNTFSMNEREVKIEIKRLIAFKEMGIIESEEQFKEMKKQLKTGKYRISKDANKLEAIREKPVEKKIIYSTDLDDFLEKDDSNEKKLT